MDRLEIMIDNVTFETPAGAARLARAGRVIEEAFALLAGKLAGTPFDRWGAAGAVVIDDLRVVNLLPDELLGPRGAERLMDELYRELLRKCG